MAGEIDDAILAPFPCFPVTDHPVKLPAWPCPVYQGRAFALSVIGAVSDLPARCIFEELFNPLYADLLYMDEVPYASEPFNIVFRIKPVLVPPSGLDQAVPFIEPQCLICSPEQL